MTFIARITQGFDLYTTAKFRPFNTNKGQIDHLLQLLRRYGTVCRTILGNSNRMILMRLRDSLRSTNLKRPMATFLELIFSPKFFTFFFQQNSSPLILITRSSTFSVIHVSVIIKNYVKKRHDFAGLFFFSLILLNKTLSCIWVAIPVDWVILHWCASSEDGRSVGRT